MKIYSPVLPTSYTALLDSTAYVFPKEVFPWKCWFWDLTAMPVIIVKNMENLHYPKYCRPNQESSKCSIYPSETKFCEPLRSTVNHFVMKIFTEWKSELRHRPPNMAFSINHVEVKHDDIINLLFKYFHWDICGNCQGLQVLLHFLDF